ncbi:MAG: arylsulfotransferase family protein [Myxococcota bacterium]
MRIPSLVAFAAVALSVALTFRVATQREATEREAAEPEVAVGMPAVPPAGANADGELAADRNAELEALGYAAFDRVEEGDRRKSGVVVLDAARVSPGLNVVFPEFGCERVEFLDAKGRAVRSLDVSALPKEECYSLKPIGDDYLFLGRPNLFRIDRSGKVVWKLTEGFSFHHDFGVGLDRIVALDRRTLRPGIDDVTGEVNDHRLVVIGPGGRVWSIVSLHDVFWDVLRRRAAARSVDPFSPEAIEALGMDGPGDFYHANSVQVLERDTAIGRAGDVLLSLRTLDRVVVLDPKTGVVRWQWGDGILDHPHHPTLLPNGHLLVFDNGWHRGWSRVVEIDPVSSAIVWEYRATAPDTFFTKRRGAAYRLANGNTLITESDRGHAFEVTPDGAKVWEYWMPPSQHADQMLRATLFRVARIEEARAS